jgi:hypothetical protein
MGTLNMTHNERSWEKFQEKYLTRKFETQGCESGLEHFGTFPGTDKAPKIHRALLQIWDKFPEVVLDALLSGNTINFLPGNWPDLEAEPQEIVTYGLADSFLQQYFKESSISGENILVNDVREIRRERLLEGWGYVRPEGCGRRD